MKRFRQTQIGELSEFQKNNRLYRIFAFWAVFGLLFMVSGIFFGVSFLFPETDESDPIPDTRRNVTQWYAIVSGIIATIALVVALFVTIFTNLN